LVGQDGDVSPHLHRILSKMGGGANMPAAKRILEINPNHPLLEKLLSKFSSDANDPVVSKYARLLFDQALLAEGSPLPDPVDYVKLVTELMVNSL
ncbi:MAG: molecular chaperone HtpG, partial [Proteobacteria bacterium]|nr:molecular chaperone HtpG [Pseudomonadota bacterium]